MRSRSRSIVKATLAIGTLVALAALASACNTVKGVGQDIQSGAEATERAISGD
ncbi:MAG TPA: hypothetical protein VFF69_10440 [Phycisphaerales bacterium]|nr:hypothetical protein [Phycisphaerales bacterium]